MKDPVLNIVVVGGGPAAVWAAIEAKKKAPSATVTLLTDEASEPYEKPPLSKAVLQGRTVSEDAPIAGAGGLAKFGVVLKNSTRCTGIDRSSRVAVSTGGEIAYDTLIIATGSSLRTLPLLPVGLANIHYLRSDVDSRSLKSALFARKRLAVVGGGLIGLEVAATASQMGLDVEVLDVASRVMSRACDEEASGLVRAAHESHGVTLRMSTGIEEVGVRPDGSLVLETTHGAPCECDLVLVGAGAIPNDGLAAAAGLETRDGILVDKHCRTSDPRIFAAGDCTRFPSHAGPVRLENWNHAVAQGAVAGRNAAGEEVSYNVLPSFWSEQYDLYIQGLGWPDPTARRIRRPMAGRGALTLEIKAGVISSAFGINAQRDLSAIRRLIDRKIPVDEAALADPSRPFSAMARATA